MTQAAYITSGESLNYSAAVNLIIVALFYGVQEQPKPRRQIDEKVKALRQSRLHVTEQELNHYETFVKQAAYNVVNL